MSSSAPSPSRFRSAYSRQSALWILRMFAQGIGRACFFSYLPDLSRPGTTEPRYAAPGVAAFLGLPSSEGADGGAAVRETMARLLRALEDDTRPVGLPRTLQRNVQAIGDRFGLDEDSRTIFGYFACRSVDPLLDEAFSPLHDSADTIRSLSRVLRLPRRAVAKALDPQQPLLRFRLIAGEPGRTSRRSDRFKVGNEDLMEHLFHERYDLGKVLKAFRVRPTAAPELEARHFPHLRGSLDCLLPYLRRAVGEGRSGVNILLHGMPGTGKTELSRIVGKALRLPVYEVESKVVVAYHEDFGGRLASLEKADATLAGSPALIVFDEAEDVLFSSPFERSTADANKAWFVEVLERNRTPVIWISNSIGGLDPAFARRFDMVVEVPVPPREERRRLVAATVGDLVGSDLGDRIAASRLVAPAVLKRAARVVGTALGEAPVEERESALTRLLGATVKAQGHADPFGDGAGIGACGRFDPALLNTPCDLAAVARRLRSVGEARLCLHGPPGTGKTAFGHWLAEELDRPLLAKRVSDLIGPYVGQTEQRIGEAFEEAAQDGAVLLIDEIDSFLAKREHAHRTWEITCVNEMLTRIEAFRGVLVGSTNRLEALDPASLRRFDWKLAFDYLRGGQVEALLLSQCRLLKLPEPGPSLRDEARRLRCCTPGDFAAAARRHRFDPFDGAEDLMAAVAEEIRHRQPVHPPIGFA